MHIPPGFDVYLTKRTKLFRIYSLWKPDYIKRYEAEIAEFAPYIAAIFSGHLHAEWAGIISEKNKFEISSFGVPAVSPIFGGKPSFKVYNYQENSLNFNDVYTYQVQPSNWVL